MEIFVHNMYCSTNDQGFILIVPKSRKRFYIVYTCLYFTGMVLGKLLILWVNGSYKPHIGHDLKC